MMLPQKLQVGASPRSIKLARASAAWTEPVVGRWSLVVGEKLDGLVPASAMLSFVGGKAPGIWASGCRTASVAGRSGNAIGASGKCSP